MSLKPNRSIIIVGAGPLMSRSLSLYLASHNWQIILISRSETSLAAYAKEISEKYPSAPKPLYRAADAAVPASLTSALDWAASQTSSGNGKIDVLCYNAARVAPSPLLTLDPEVLVQDFHISAVGTLVAGQWFMEHANKSHIPEGEYPMFLVPGGSLDKYPEPDLASLSAVKSASQNLVKQFWMVMKGANILVGAPLIGGAVGAPGGEERMNPDPIVEGLFKPFFEEREALKGLEDWDVERAW
jgi:NAD(P)-dependent dehydrogenase (short-subunit alcohol dehydrogenase family)